MSSATEFTQSLCAAFGVSFLACSTLACSVEQLGGSDVTSPSDETAPQDETEPAECELSVLGAAVHRAATNVTEAERTIPSSMILSFDNVAGDTLVDGGEIFPMIGDLISGANESANIAMFVWEVGSDAHNEVERGLLELNSRLTADQHTADPVVVRILVNVVLAPDNEAQIGGELRAAIDSLNLDPRYIDAQVATRRHSGLDAMHHKLVVIDDATALVGGANVEAVHNWQSGALPWHDSAYTVHGEVAIPMVLEYAERWSEGDEWSCASGVCSSQVTERFVPFFEPAPVGDCAPMIVLARRPTGWFNNDIDNPQDAGYLAAFSNARKVIKVQTPNLSDDDAKNALLEAVIRGTRVELLLAYRFNELTVSIPGQGGGNGVNVDWLYENAIATIGEELACQRLDARWYSRNGQVVEGNVAGASHLKYTSFDERMAIVGSTNMDTQSWNQSGEVNIAIDDIATTGRFDARVFNPHFENAARTLHCAN